MTLGPSPVERLNRARADLRMGVPVAIVAAGGVLVVAAAETLESERLAAFRALGSPVVGLTARRAEVLKVAAYDGDLVRITLPTEADIGWIRDLADPSHDLSRPMKGPFRAQRDGDAAPMRAALSLIKSAHLLPAAVAVTLTESDADLTHLDMAELPALLAAATAFHPVAAARVPLAAAEAGRVHVFRPEAGGEDHYAIEIGSPDRNKPVLARLHSACFTGDVLGSLKCDCGAQLAAALAQMAEEGAGVLLYLNQEGRGIGLANKMRAYSLQDQGFDTVEANHRLGFEDDERDFRIGAEILRRMGFASVRLLTNNPAKITMMEKAGVAVTERVPLKVGRTSQNAAYLATKAKKSGHLL
jgi:GTP cyclohydrolase II